MPDLLTPDELDAIARFRGPIQVIPRGVSGIDPLAEVSWRKQMDKTYANREAAKRAKIAATQRANLLAKRALLPEMVRHPGEERETAMMRLHSEGRSWSEIGTFFNVTATSAHRYCKRRGLL